MAIRAAVVQIGPVEVGWHLGLVVQLQVSAVRALPCAGDVAHYDAVVRAVWLRAGVEVIHADSVCRWSGAG